MKEANLVAVTAGRALALTAVGAVVAAGVTTLIAAAKVLTGLTGLTRLTGLAGLAGLTAVVAAAAVITTVIEAAAVVKAGAVVVAATKVARGTGLKPVAATGALLPGLAVYLSRQTYGHELKLDGDTVDLDALEAAHGLLGVRHGGVLDDTAREQTCTCNCHCHTADCGSRIVLAIRIPAPPQCFTYPLPE